MPKKIFNFPIAGRISVGTGKHGDATVEAFKGTVKDVVISYHKNKAAIIEGDKYTSIPLITSAFRPVGKGVCSGGNPPTE